MKKWLTACLLAIALLFVATTAMAGHTRLNGDYCEGNSFQRGKIEKDYHTLYCYHCHDEIPENHWSMDTPQYKATCTKFAVCTFCLASYGEYGPHDWGAWQSRGNNSEHVRTCQRDGCDAVDTASCSGDSSATCITLGTCATCGGQYYGAHAFPAGQNWHSDDKNHWLSCTVCREAKTKVGAHWFVQGSVSVCLKSAATCVSPSVYYTNCDYCYHKGTDTYVDPNNGPDPNNHDLVHHDAKAPTCTEIGWNAYETCQREGCTYTTKVEIPALKHDLVHHDAKAPTCTEIGWNAYETCKRDGCNYTTYKEIPALEHEIVKHDAKAPTCTEIGWEEYDTCQREGCDYTTKVEIPALNHDLVRHDAKAPTCTEVGWEAYDTCSRCDYTTYQEIPALGHDYTEQVVKPTCKEGGYTLHTCKNCKDSYKDHQTKKLLHWYGEWVNNGDGTNSATCKREDCKHVGKTECAIAECKQDEVTLTLCPVCGNVSDGTHLALVEEVTAEGEHLPQGELVLRMGEISNGNTLLSVCFEYSGKLTQPKGEVKITLPAELLNGVTLTLLNADDTEIDLPYIVEGENAAFTLDFTDAALPTALIRLIPTAE